MDRRDFLRIGGLSACAISYTPTLLAEQTCGQVVNTPYGPMIRCTAGIQAFQFQSAFQQRSNWCWAACISMVFGYYGHAVSQTRIVSETWGGIVNLPAQPSQILTDLNSSWTDDSGTDFSSTGDSLSVNNFNAVVDLQAGRPLIIGSHGHAMVLTALTADSNVQTGAYQFVEAIVRDPMVGRRVLAPMEFNNISFAARLTVS